MITSFSFEKKNVKVASNELSIAQQLIRIRPLKEHEVK